MNTAEKNFIYCKAFAAFFDSLAQWQSQCGLIGMKSSLTQQEYDVLLKGVDADVFCPLWASCAKEADRPLMDETTLSLIRFCKGYGYAPRRIDGNPPDYLGEQFHFLEYLYSAARADPQLLHAARDFEDQFTIATVQAFASGCRQYCAQNEVQTLLQQMEAFFAGTAGEPEETPQCLAALESSAGAVLQAPLPVEEPYTVCSAGINNCGGKCKINITVAEGCALEISTDDTDNAPQIRACQRGRGYRRTFLSPKRLRYPMKRVGQRGEGKFRRITWEEAAREIGEAALRTGQKYGPSSRYFLYGTGNCGVMRADHMLKRLMNLDTGFLDAYNSYSSACSTFVAPYLYGDSNGGNSERDVLNSKLLILWGHNPAETVFGSLRSYYLAKAKAKGIPVIVIDPRMSDTALALAEEWIPIRPSTDGALADAMAYVIVEKGLHDLSFLHQFCLGFDEETLPDHAPKGSSYLSYLMGCQDGIPKTPQWAQEICGVPAQTIQRLAIRYAKTKPAAILPGLGPQRHGNGEQGTRSIAALACLTGNVGKPGGSAGVPGFCPPRPKVAFPQGDAPYPGRIPTFLWTKALEKGSELQPVQDGLQGVAHLDSSIKLLFCIASNTLINQHGDIHHTVGLLQDPSLCELIVVSDLFMTPSARFADLLLPAPSVLESNNMTFPWANDDYLLSNSRAVEPLFGTMPDYDWVRLVARNMGLEQAFAAGRETEMDWIQDLYDQLRLQEPDLPPYPQFRERGGFQFPDTGARVAYQENIRKNIPFHTPSGKIELFSMDLYQLQDPERIPAIPRYVPAPEGPADPRTGKYPLQLIGYHTKRRCHSIHDQNSWLEELDPPALWIHPEDARERGITQGQLVEVFNDRGTIRIPAKVTPRIMQGVTALSQGGWYTPDKNQVDIRGSINVLTSADCPTPLAKGNPQHTNLVQVRAAAIN